MTTIEIIRTVAKQGIITTAEEVCSIRQMRDENPEGLSMWRPEAVEAILAAADAPSFPYQQNWEPGYPQEAR